MRTLIVLKSLSDLPSDKVQVAVKPASTIRESLQNPDHAAEEDFSEMQHHRYTTPFVSTIPYRHFGINE